MVIDIRDARVEDVPGILAIYNDVIATSTAVYREDPATLDDRRQWFEARQAQSCPVLVAHDSSGILGFASYGDFRPWPGYRYSVEHTVHIKADQRGRGVGTLLMQALIERAVAQKKHVMIGGVDADNEASLRFHERLGFTRAARLEQVGFKFGRWLDLVFVQRILDTGPAEAGHHERGA
ncbi:MAG TPA: GNAT family N-acetyltransferase [Vicinamibacterales bacterium]|nr:GNAT family N-acetyltransferase [Vicinamibacterales bacterium]